MSELMRPRQLLQDRLVLVTGASGFIGQHLTKSLTQQGARVIATGRASSDSVESLDCASFPDLKRVLSAAHQKYGRPIEFIFHLAGEKSAGAAKERASQTLSENYRSTLNLLEAARELPGFQKLVLISSLAVYEHKAVALASAGYKESDPVASESIYSASKLASEGLGTAYFHDFNMPVVSARLANVYGPGQSTLAVIPSLLQQMKELKEISFGNTAAVRDFIYVQDVVDALIQLSLTPASSGKIVNIGTGIGTSIQTVIETLAELTQFNGQLKIDPDKLRPMEASAVIADVSLIKQITAWHSRVTIKDGFRSTAQAMENN